MTRRRILSPLARAVAVPLALGALLLASPPSARAGWDDFEFGQRLIERGYTDYARRVFEGVLADDKRTPADKERARFGMALLGKADTIRVMYDPRVPYAAVKEQLDRAIADIEAFLQKNPNDPKADDARMETGDLRLTFTQWGAELAGNEMVDDPASDDPEKRIRLSDLRQTKPETVREDMQRAVKSAGETFNALQTGAKDPQTKTLAGFRFVVTQYFAALAHPECSQPGVAALKSAEKVLRDYSEINEQYLTGAYAQDFLGLVYQQLGDCEGGQDKAKQYLEALGWFQAVSSLEDTNEESRKLIAKGYYHLGRLANAAKDLNNYAFLKAARRDYEQMDARAPRVKRLEDGILAYVEWALIEDTLGDRAKAIDLCSKASEFAKDVGSRRAELRANDVLGKIVAGGSGTGSGGIEGDPSIVQKVADDLFAKSRWLEAVAAYRRVIASAPQTRQGLVDFAIPSWKRIGDAYRALDLWFEAAIAYEAIVDEVRSGRISNKVDSDPTAKIAFEAAGLEIAMLDEISKRTGDRAVKERKDARIERRAKDFETGSVGDQLFNLALQRFNQAQDDKGRKVAGWENLAAQARTGFAEVAKNAKSEYQDNALQYLVRVPLLLEKPAEALAEADRALAWWETPEAKARLAGNDTLATRRRQQRAWTALWRASALRDLKRDAEALAAVEGFAKAHPGADRATLERAKGLEVETLADLGRIEDAERELTVLQREFPEYHALGAILLKISAHYRTAVTAVGAKLDEIRWRLGGKTGEDGKFVPGLRQQIADLLKEEGRRSAALGDLRTTVSRAEAELRAAEEKVADPATPEEERRINEEKVKRLKESLEKQRPQVAAAQAALAKVRADGVAAEKERQELVARRREIEKEQAVPLRRLAELYRGIDEVVKDLDAAEPPGGKRRRRPDLVFNVATQYYQLARVEGDVVADWTATRAIFEDYLSFPEVKALPETDERKRQAMRALGDAYYRVADAATDPAKRQEAYATAVGYLQAGLAKLPQNTPIVVGHLAGESVVLPWQAKPPLQVDGTWRIPIPRSNSVAELRANVAALTRERLPRYAAARTDENYWRVVQQFKEHVSTEALISTAELDRTVLTMKAAGFDPIFFSEHAVVTPPDALLALARAYARSGVAANGLKAFNLTTAVVYGSRVEVDGPEWWEAKTIALEVQLSDAERELQASGDQSAKAKVAAKDVETMISSMKKLYPHIGGTERHEETLKEWKEIQQRLRALMAALRLPTVPVDLDAAPPREPEEAPPAPAAGGPGEDAGGAGMDR
jgi:hypothetical protein